MSLEFKQVVSSDTYDRWIEGNGNDSYIIARYHWRSQGHTYKEDPHFEAYYLSMHFAGSQDLKTYDEAVAACLAHQKQRNQST